MNNMLRIFSFTLLFLLFQTVNAQYYKVTPQGLTPLKTPEKNYLVIDFDSLNKKELYKKSIAFINETYENPKEAIKADTENEYIRVKTYIPNFMKVNNGGVNIIVDNEYTLELKFKDNKVRFEILEEKFCDSYCVVYSGSKWTSYPIYTKKGKLRLEKNKLIIETYFNAKVQTFIDYLKKSKTKDDW